LNRCAQEIGIMKLREMQNSGGEFR
jgi:hypothetical protein